MFQQQYRVRGKKIVQEIRGVEANSYSLLFIIEINIIILFPSRERGCFNTQRNLNLHFILLMKLHSVKYRL